VDRLIALVMLRFRLEARAIAGSRGRKAGLLLALPVLAFLSAASALVAFVLVGLVSRTEPRLLLPALSAVATLFGLTWALSPLLAGVGATETHDLSRLMPYPVPLPALVVSSLLANLLQPTVVAQGPPLAALALALAGAGPRWPIAFFALLLGLLVVLAAGQATGIALHALSRNRRWHDRAIFAGIGLGVALSLAPILMLSRGGHGARRLVAALLERDIFLLSPFAWAARAAVHAGRGEALGFLGFCAGATLALAAAIGVSTLLAQRLYRGELDTGEADSGASSRARLRLPGAVGAIAEKDLRVAWRDPRLKAVSLSGVIGPLLLLFLLGQGASGGVGPAQLFWVASLAGLGVVGSNAFALEREGLGLLLGFPVDRLSVLVGKNLAGILLRLPVLVALSLAALVLVGPAVVPAVAALVLLTQVVASAADNYLGLLFPIPVPAAGRDPNAPVSGSRGLGAAAVGFVAMLAALAASAPFALLAWLPHLLGEPWLWLPSLPLALAGAAAVYFMAAAGAARLLQRREPELIARLAGEE
jgi:ABC-2 type transport system permease protein